MTLLDEPVAPPRVKRWTKREYYDVVDRGAFRGQRVWLRSGELIEMPAMGALHAIGITNITAWLVSTFHPEFRVRIQVPLETPGETVPQPDAAVVLPEQNIRRPHPNAAVLVIEVRDSSVELDREMAFDYAAALVPEYWLLNMRDRTLEVYREPVAAPAAPVGFRYASHHVLAEGESVASLARPAVPVGVSALVSTTA